MSDEIYWIPVALWSAGVFLRVDSAIRSWWTNRGNREEERRLMESDWWKIRRGETKRGYRMWFERQCCKRKSILDNGWHYYALQMPFPNDYDWSEWVKRELTSVFMTIDHPMPNAGQRVRSLRRYSFFEPSVYTDIAQMIYPAGGGWRSVFSIQLDYRTVAMAFKNKWSGQICVVLIDIKQRLYRLLSVPPILPFFDPEDLFHGGSTRILYVRRGEGQRSNRLRIVCECSQWNQSEIISVDYEIRQSKKNPSRFFAVEIGRQSITIPGSRAWFVTSIPGVHLLRANELHSSDFVYVITIDQRGDFRVRHYEEWNQAIKATDIERRSREVDGAFEPMLPEQFLDECIFYRYYNYILGRVGDSFAKRQIYPPSMMHVAAEAICQSKPPNADVSMIKSEIGIDIFDGIVEDQEKPVPTIYLPSNAELMQDE